MQTPRAAVVEVQTEGCCIASCHQSPVLHHVWRDTVQNDWTGHLDHHLYITVMHALEPQDIEEVRKLECGPMPNVMVALPNIGGALCSTPQSLADAHYLTAVQ